MMILGWLANKVKWVALALAAVVLAAGAGLAFGWYKGSGLQKSRNKVEAVRAKVRTAKATVAAVKIRQEVEHATATLPDAPPQQVADADSDTAAGGLRDAGWVRRHPDAVPAKRRTM